MDGNSHKIHREGKLYKYSMLSKMLTDKYYFTYITYDQITNCKVKLMIYPFIAVQLIELHSKDIEQ